MRLFFVAFALSAGVCAQVKPTNPGFEIGEAGSRPIGWNGPANGWDFSLVDQGCRNGKCVLMTGTDTPPANAPFGNLSQSIPADGYRLRRIRYRAAVKVAGAGTRAQLWLRLDRANNSVAFLENMQARPITSSEWKEYEIETQVPEDVSRMFLGVILFGPGKAWVDDVSLEVLGEVLKDKAEPARPLTEQGLVNLTAFTKLYGYVRHFHPSDQAARTDWETFAVEGVRRVEDAKNAAELAARLQEVFGPIAPTARVFAAAKTPEAVEAVKGPELVGYKHVGVGLPTSTISMNIYRSEREHVAASELPKVFEAELAAGVRASVPLAVYADEKGTLPHAGPAEAPPLYARTAADRATRLAAVAIAWNVFQHFYPYFDVVKTDWPAELSKGLRAAATDADEDAFLKTLQRLVAALHDGHGRVGGGRGQSFLLPPVTIAWVEDQLVVTRVQNGKAEGVAPGDRVVKIDGTPVEQAAAEARELISAATDGWMRSRLAAELSWCRAGRVKTLELEALGSGERKTVELECAPPKGKDPETYPEARPVERIAELEPGILYVDLDRVEPKEFDAAMPKLEAAKGIVFDMRGYPGQPGISALAHLTDTALRSAKWNVSSMGAPDQSEVKWNESGWPVPPQKPYLGAKRVFLTDGRAISYAETVMGIVEAFHLGEIVGEATAGTNGNVNPFRLPGGYTVSWTGMKVLKHDGSQHHGVGIRPTVPVSRTRKGVAAGRDEVLERGVEVVKR